MSYNKREVEMKEGLLLSKVRRHVSRQMIVGGVLMIATLMIFNVGSFTRAANSDTSELNVNVAAGSLTISDVDGTVDFSSGTAGVASEVQGELHNITISDYRASPDKWTLYGNSALLNGTGALNIPAANITVFPTEVAKENVATFDTNMVDNGTDESTLDGNVLLFNSGWNTAGVIIFNSLDLNATLSSSLTADDYGGTMKLTVIATP